MTTIGLADGIDREIAETDTMIGNDPQTAGDAEVESEITMTGETIHMMMGHEGAARTLLTRGPVAEAKTIAASLLAGLATSNQARSVHRLFILLVARLNCPHRYLS